MALVNSAITVSAPTSATRPSSRVCSVGTVAEVATAPANVYSAAISTLSMTSWAKVLMR